MEKIENVKIKNVSLTIEDHDIFTFYLTVAGDGWETNIGGYTCATRSFDASLNKYMYNTTYGTEAVWAMLSIMEVVGVSKWEDLTGKYCRVVREGLGYNIYKIGNIIKDQWIDLKKIFSQAIPAYKNTKIDI